METKKVNLNKKLEEWFKELMPRLSEEQVREIQQNPDIVVNAIIEAYKQVCEEHGIDYTTTSMYQEEMKYRQQKQ